MRPRLKSPFASILVGALLISCQPDAAQRSAPDAPLSPARDPHSFSRPDRVKVTHAELEWTVDFERQQLAGGVTWHFERAAGADEDPLVLDTRGLKIEAVRTVSGEPLPYEWGEADSALGTALQIHPTPGQDRVVIRYRTGPASAALQWLSPTQTAGATKPFLFSQAQAILARTMLPCQDSPGVRVTYTAEVTAPAGIEVVMAARRVPGGGDGRPFRFEMPQAIPSYLIAIAAGDIVFRELGPRTGVYAEPPLIERAAYEFADTEAMMEACEELYGPYRWERYDIIVLPPSFPFGGMENPRLTFATPTILAGDRSLVSLVAHELAHSWSGNLVTNATWADFWLNEGFTVYLERRISERVYGKARAEMEAMLGRQDLLAELPELEEGFTVLHTTSLGRRDPDEAFSDVPYEKGYLFLRLLEEQLGRDRFDAFLRDWFDTNAFQSRTTPQFEHALREAFADDAARLDAVGVEEWLYQPGLPANAPQAQSDAFSIAEEQARLLAQGAIDAASLPADEWTTHEWLHFLRSLPQRLPAETMGEIDRAWSLTDTGNSEILAQWLRQSIRSEYAPANEALERFLTSMGRRKFLKPLYTELAATPQGKERGLRIYERARPLYHTISRHTIDEILGYEPS